MSQSKRLADRRGHGNLPSLTNARRPPSPPVRTTTAMSTLPPYKLIPDDAIGQPHHPGTEPPPVDIVVKKLEDKIQECRGEGKRLADEWPGTEQGEAQRSAKLHHVLKGLESARFQLFLYALLQKPSRMVIYRYIEAQQKANRRLEQEQAAALTDEEKVLHTANKHVSRDAAEALHVDANIRACNASLKDRKNYVNSLERSIKTQLHGDDTLEPLKPDFVAGLATFFKLRPPPQGRNMPWPSSLEQWDDEATFGQVNHLYRGEDPWLAQGREEYGHVDEGRPASP